MLVIDLVELVAGDRFEKVREFYRADPVRLQDDANALDKGVEVRHLGENIVAENKVGLHPRCGQLARRLDAKELHQCRDPALFGGPGNIRRRVDAEDGNSPLDKELQQITVIATELDDAA